MGRLEKEVGDHHAVNGLCSCANRRCSTELVSLMLTPHMVNVPGAIATTVVVSPAAASQNVDKVPHVQIANVLGLQHMKAPRSPAGA